MFLNTFEKNYFRFFCDFVILVILADLPPPLDPDRVWACLGAASATRGSISAVRWSLEECYDANQLSFIRTIDL